MPRVSIKKVGALVEEQRQQAMPELPGADPDSFGKLYSTLYEYLKHSLPYTSNRKLEYYRDDQTFSYSHEVYIRFPEEFGKFFTTARMEFNIDPKLPIVDQVNAIAESISAVTKWSDNNTWALQRMQLAEQMLKEAKKEKMQAQQISA